MYLCLCIYIFNYKFPQAVPPLPDSIEDPHEYPQRCLAKNFLDPGLRLPQKAVFVEPEPEP
jgi:hypothetical protein